MTSSGDPGSGPLARCLCLALTAVMAGAATVEIRLRPEVELAARSAALADIADLSGDPAAVAALGAVAVQELSPTPVLIDERLVRLRTARQAAGVALNIGGECRVRQRLRTWPVDEQVAVATALVVHPGDDARVALLRASGPLIAGDAGGGQRLVAEPIDRSAVGDVPVRIRLLAGTTEQARALVVLRVQRFATAAVLASEIRRGQTIGLADVEVRRVELQPATQDALRRIEDVVGRVAIRDLAAGAVVTPNAIQLPFDVRPGQAVTLLFRTGTVELSAPGEALAGGRVGEVVAVRRTADDRRVRGQVVAPGRVLVNF